MAKLNKAKSKARVIEGSQKKIIRQVQTTSVDMGNIPIKIYKRGTSDLLTFEQIDSNLRSSIELAGKLDNESAMYVFFLSLTWNTFFQKYKRGESFSDYIKTLPISETKIYAILSVVKMLGDYFDINISERSEEFLIENEDSKLTVDFIIINKIFDPINNIGLSKLELVTRIKDKDVANKIISDLVEGKEISARQIATIKNEANNKLLIKSIVEDGNGIVNPEQFDFKIKGNAVEIGNSTAFTFSNDFDKEEKRRIIDREKVSYNILKRGNIPVVFECQNKNDISIGQRAILEHRKNK